MLFEVRLATNKAFSEGVSTIAAGKLPVRLRRTAPQPQARLRAATCMPAMTAMFTRTRVRDGKSMALVAGAAWRSRRHRRAQRSRSRQRARGPLRSSERRGLSSSGLRPPNRCRDCRRRRRTGKGAPSRPNGFSNLSGLVASEVLVVGSLAEEAEVVVVRDDFGSLPVNC